MVGIAIINYKTYEKTIECIDSIRKTTKIPYKIFLLDNASLNGSVQKLNDEYKDSNDVELIISDTNEGYARGNNICIKRMIESGCDYGVISNNDIVCEKDAIELLINDLKKKKEYLLVGPRIELPNGDYQKSIILDEYGKIEYLQKSTYLYNFHKRKNKKEKSKLEALNAFTDVCWVSGAFFAFDLKKMKEVGGFDPNTFLFFEEYILAAKAKEKNYLLGYNPSSVVKHDHAFTTGGGININSKIVADRSEMYYFKNYTKNGKLFLALLRVIRKMEVFFTFGKKKDFKSIKRYKRETRKNGEVNE